MMKFNIIYATIISALIFLVATLSYNYNYFHVVSDEWFTEHSPESEQLVLDGILNSAITGEEAVLGKYPRPEIEESYFNSKAREFFRNQQTGGEFERYVSQYGLQVKLYDFMYESGIDLSTKYSLTAMTMAFAIVLLFVFIYREFSLLSALITSAVLIFSPWMIVFARNLYWVPVLWFIPVIISCYLSKPSLRSKKYFLILVISLFFAFFIKFLCGYEYITTIFIAVLLPFLYFSYLNQQTLVNIFIKSTAIFASFLTAFILALSLHVNSLSDNNESGFYKVYYVAAKRLLPSDNSHTSNVAENVCEGSKACEDTIAESLNSNPIKVLISYLVMFDFVPWISSLEFSESERQIVSDLYRKPGMASINNAIDNLSFVIIAKTFSVLLFLSFLAFSLYRAYKIDKLVLLLFLIALSAPISWYVLAKGHSYIHKHLNYVLWYLPTIVVGVLIICESFRKRGKDE